MRFENHGRSFCVRFVPTVCIGNGRYYNRPHLNLRHPNPMPSDPTPTTVYTVKLARLPGFEADQTDSLKVKYERGPREPGDYPLKGLLDYVPFRKWWESKRASVPATTVMREEIDDKVCRDLERQNIPQSKFKWGSKPANASHKHDGVEISVSDGIVRARVAGPVLALINHSWHPNPSAGNEQLSFVIKVEMPGAAADAAALRSAFESPQFKEAIAGAYACLGTGAALEDANQNVEAALKNTLRAALEANRGGVPRRSEVDAATWKIATHRPFGAENDGSFRVIGQQKKAPGLPPLGPHDGSAGGKAPGSYSYFLDGLQSRPVMTKPTDSLNL